MKHASDLKHQISTTIFLETSAHSYWFVSTMVGIKALQCLCLIVIKTNSETLFDKVCIHSIIHSIMLSFATYYPQTIIL